MTQPASSNCLGGLWGVQRLNRLLGHALGVWSHESSRQCPHGLQSPALFQSGSDQEEDVRARQKDQCSPMGNSLLAAALMIPDPDRDSLGRSKLRPSRSAWYLVSSGM